MNKFYRVCRCVILAAAMMLTAVSCQTQTPASRIAANPVMFRNLPANQQLLVQQGRICDGMSPDAVYLAWGKPSGDPVKGQQGGKIFERWVYMRMRAVPTTGMGVGFWRGGYGGAFGGYDPFVYIPEEVANVRFENNRVTSWERRSQDTNSYAE